MPTTVETGGGYSRRTRFLRAVIGIGGGFILAIGGFKLIKGIPTFMGKVAAGAATWATFETIKGATQTSRGQTLPTSFLASYYTTNVVIALSELKPLLTRLDDAIGRYQTWERSYRRMNRTSNIGWRGFNFSNMDYIGFGS